MLKVASVQEIVVSFMAWPFGRVPARASSLNRRPADGPCDRTGAAPARASTGGARRAAPRGPGRPCTWGRAAACGAAAPWSSCGHATISRSPAQEDSTKLSLGSHRGRAAVSLPPAQEEVHARRIPFNSDPAALVPLRRKQRASAPGTGVVDNIAALTVAQRELHRP